MSTPTMSQPKQERKFFEHNLAVALLPPPPTLELWEVVDNFPDGDVTLERLTILGVQARSLNKYAARKADPDDWGMPNPLDHRENGGWWLWHSEIEYSCLFFSSTFGIVSTEDACVDGVNVRYVIVDTSKPGQATALKAEAVEALKKRRG